MANIHSSKAKARIGQQEIRDLILKHFPELQADDVVSNPMGNQGADIMLSPKAQELVPLSIEVKRRKSFSMSDYMGQARSHSNRNPVVFYRCDRGEWYASITATYLMELLKR